MPKGSKPARRAPAVLDAAIVERMAMALVPAALAQADRDAMHSRLLKRIRAEAPPGTFTIRATDMKWIRVGKGVEIKTLRVDRERNDQTVLIRMQPGAVVAVRRHTQEEECLVLEGEVYIGSHLLRAGDRHVARLAARHAQIRAPGGALLLIRSEIPPQSFRSV
jgi:anti-sigma factor ChrR (cupin superfamily)